MFLSYLMIGTGSALGGMTRYAISKVFSENLPFVFPMGTLVVNVLGSFIAALVVFFLAEKSLISPNTKLFLITGFCGGFTTLSTFTLETTSFFRGNEFAFAFLNILSNIILPICGIFLALYLSRFLTKI
ncbi:MAG TPA: fluoride efflux transporter CrcB [Candidatus Paceibacterota bacterium]|nr:fluoride efflux transporter CrcB [Candidatus Paceibacterota bacterium]